MARRVRAAHRAQVWVPLGHTEAGASARAAEFGISRAQAYRLIDIAELLQQAIYAAGVLAVSPAGDTEPGNALDLGPSQRALREVQGRLDELSRTVAERLTAAGQTGSLDIPAVRAIVHQGPCAWRRLVGGRAGIRTEALRRKAAGLGI
jgi:hypothetical protein